MKQGIRILAVLLIGFGLYWLVPAESTQPANSSTPVADPILEKKAAIERPLSPVPAPMPETIFPATKSAALETAQEESRMARRKQTEMIQAVKDNPHITPTVVIQSGRKIGEIAMLEGSHPEWREKIQKFYLECAKDAGAITVTRVQCLDHFIKSRQLSPPEIEAVLQELPLAVRKLHARFTAEP